MNRQAQSGGNTMINERNKNSSIPIDKALDRSTAGRVDKA